jgi:hypothetical protein
MRLAQHAACVMPGARSPWAEAMRRELDYIEHDSAALRWALGCVLASYRTRLAHRPWLSTRSWRRVAVSSALMLLVGFTLQVSAEGQTEPPQPDEATCDRPDVNPAGVSLQIAPNGHVVRRDRDGTGADRVKSDCADRDLPNRPDAQAER